MIFEARDVHVNLRARDQWLYRITHRWRFGCGTTASWFCVHWCFCLVAPLVVIIPLSFNAGTYFTFSDAMLRLDPDAFSLRWYAEIFDPPNRPGVQGNEWFVAAWNSFFIAVIASAIATALGTVAVSD